MNVYHSEVDRKSKLLDKTLKKLSYLKKENRKLRLIQHWSADRVKQNKELIRKVRSHADKLELSGQNSAYLTVLKIIAYGKDKDAK